MRCTAATPRAGSTTACAPNCEADEDNDRIFIKAIRNIKAGEELNYDYGLIIDEPYTKKLKAEYPCWCGSALCRGTLLSPKERKDTPKTPSQKKAKAKDKVKNKDKVKSKADGKTKSKSDAKAKDKKKSSKAAKPAKADKTPSQKK
jgi:uncharacterized protein